MKFDVDDKNRCRLVCVKFHLNRCRFAVAVAKCLVGSLFWDTVYNSGMTHKTASASSDTLTWEAQRRLVASSTPTAATPLDAAARIVSWTDQRRGANRRHTNDGTSRDRSMIGTIFASPHSSRRRARRSAGRCFIKLLEYSRSSPSHKLRRWFRRTAVIISHRRCLSSDRRGF